MSPNMGCEVLQVLPPRLTVAKRKEALELRKVSELSEFELIFLYFLCFALKCSKWQISLKNYVYSF